MKSTAEIFVHMIRGDALYLVDAQGRPLGEQGAPELYARCARDERPCPFLDSRVHAGLPINHAALAQVRRSWPLLRDRLSWLLDAYWGDGPLSGHQSWVLNASTLALPSLSYLRGARHIPVDVAASFKTSLGFSTVLPAVLMGFPGSSDRPLRDLYTPEAFFDMLERESWLIGSHQVCAGSRHAIASYYERLTAPSPFPEETNPGIDAAALRAFVEAYLEAWAAVGMAASAARAILLDGWNEETPGYTRGRRDDASWPACARWTRDPVSRVLEIVNTFPGLTPAHFLVLYPEAEPNEGLEALFQSLPTGPERGVLARIDELVLDALQAPARRMARAVGDDDPPPLPAGALHALLARAR